MKWINFVCIFRKIRNYYKEFIVKITASIIHVTIIVNRVFLQIKTLLCELSSYICIVISFKLHGRGQDFRSLLIRLYLYVTTNVWITLSHVSKYVICLIDCVSMSTVVTPRHVNRVILVSEMEEIAKEDRLDSIMSIDDLQFIYEFSDYLNFLFETIRAMK